MVQIAVGKGQAKKQAKIKALEKEGRTRQKAKTKTKASRTSGRILGNHSIESQAKTASKVEVAQSKDVNINR